MTVPNDVNTGLDSSTKPKDANDDVNVDDVTGDSSTPDSGKAQEDPKKTEETVPYDRFNEVVTNNQVLTEQVNRLTEIQNTLITERQKAQTQVPQQQADPLEEKAREILGDEGVEVVGQMIDRERQKVEDRLTKDDTARTAREVEQQLSSQYPELLDRNSEMFRRTAEECVRLRDMGVDTPNLALIAARHVASQLKGPDNANQSPRSNGGNLDSSTTRPISPGNPEKSDKVSSGKLDVGAKLGYSSEKSTDIAKDFSKQKTKGLA